MIFLLVIWQEGPVTSLFISDKIGSLDTVLARHRLLAGPEKSVEEVTRPGIPKTELFECLDHLCNLQSAGNSSRPQVDVIAHVLRKLGANDDVGKL